MAKFAIIKTGGKQRRVSEGDTIFVEKIEGDDGKAIKFDTLLVADENGKEVEIGTPLVKSQVEGKIVEQTKDKKIEVIKFKAKSRYRRKHGHQQLQTKVEITKV